MVIEKSLSACTAPKFFDRCRTSSSGVTPSKLLILARSAEPALRLIDQHRDDDDGAHRDELPERLDIDEHQPVLDDRDHQRAGYRTENRAGAAKQAGAADDHGGNAIE